MNPVKYSLNRGNYRASCGYSCIGGNSVFLEAIEEKQYLGILISENAYLCRKEKSDYEQKNCIDCHGGHDIGCDELQ